VRSIKRNLQHIVSAQATWLARVRSNVAPVPLDTREELRAAYMSTHRAWLDAVGEMDDGDWTRAIDYVDSSGAPQRTTFGQIISHVVNHGTHHRAETGLLLGMDGHSPGDMDFVYFVRDELGAETRQGLGL
jgi:uncharacterized damage-inducible protein DinB